MSEKFIYWPNEYSAAAELEINEAGELVACHRVFSYHPDYPGAVERPADDSYMAYLRAHWSKVQQEYGYTAALQRMTHD